MNIKTVKVGYLKTNCYILNINNDTLIIDPGDEADKIIENITGNVLGIIITHNHFDHVGALDDILKFYNVPVYNKNNVFEGKMNIGNFSFDVIYTPGHKEDSITLYYKEEKCMFVGDFIFKDAIGRTDLPGGNVFVMKKSIENILKYDDDIVIYPGHNDMTTLGEERSNLLDIMNRI